MVVESRGVIFRYYSAVKNYIIDNSDIFNSCDFSSVGRQVKSYYKNFANTYVERQTEVNISHVI